MILRRIAAVALGVLGCVLIVVVLRHGEDHARGPGGVVQTRSTSPPVLLTTPSGPAAVSGTPGPDDLRAAAAEAGEFAVAYVGYRYDDTAGSVQDRVRPFATVTFVDQLAESSSAAQLWADRRQRHEVARGSVDAIQYGGLDDHHRLILVAQLTVTTSWDGGSAATTHFLEMFLVQVDGDWRVDEVQE